MARGEKSNVVTLRQYIIQTLVIVLIMATLWGLLTANFILKLEDAYQILACVLSFIFAGVVIGISSVVKNYRAFVKPLNIISEMTYNLSNRDLTYNIDMKRAGKQKQILSQLEKSQDSLAESFKVITGESAEIEKLINMSQESIGSLDIQIGSISKTTDEFASSLEETVASIEEMNSIAEEIENSIQTIADKAHEGALSASETNKRAEELQSKAANSRSETEKLFTDTQKELLEALRKVKDVEKINTLSDAIMQITTQTNLLSLNAAIEAARAGESGKGFAVVADEIRALAEQSNRTVSEIQEIIRIIIGSVDQLSKSSQKVLGFIDERIMNDYKTIITVGEQYGKDAAFYDNMSADLSATTEELLASVQMISKVLGEISGTSNQSALNIKEISTSLGDVAKRSNEVVSQNTEIKRITGELSNVVNSFKL